MVAPMWNAHCVLPSSDGGVRQVVHRKSWNHLLVCMRCELLMWRVTAREA